MFFDFIKTIPQYFLPKKGITVLAGYLANVKNPFIKNFIIQQFIKQYQVNMCEALVEDPTAYLCFNDFFIRHLKPEARVMATSDIISPVDGCVSVIGSIEKEKLIQAKGREYTVQQLLACSKDVATQFTQGQFVTLYLSPKDYHRVHMPMDAELVSMKYIPGALFSVQPSTVRVVPNLFARNERLAVFFDTAIGPMAMVLVGATIVGAIGTRWHGDLVRTNKNQAFEYARLLFKKGDEMGYFKLGSTVILLFANSHLMKWNDNISMGRTICYGQALGDYLPKSMIK